MNNMEDINKANNELRVLAQKLRMHIKTNKKLRAKYQTFLKEACTAAEIELEETFIGGLVLIHQTELVHSFEVPTPDLPVGIQCK